jgi:hypothetical protein
LILSYCFIHWKENRWLTVTPCIALKLSERVLFFYWSRMVSTLAWLLRWLYIAEIEYMGHMKTCVCFLASIIKKIVFLLPTVLVSNATAACASCSLDGFLFFLFFLSSRDDQEQFLFIFCLEMSRRVGILFVLIWTSPWYMYKSIARKGLAWELRTCG